MKKIPLTKGKFALVDDEDYEYLMQWKWSVSCDRYAATRHSILKKNVYMHRLLMNPPKGKEVDHINGDGFNNRRSNLRVCFHNQNVMNTSKQKKKTTSNYRGVSWSTRDKIWVSRLNLNKKVYTIGTFKEEHHAALAWDIWAKELYGTYFKPNFESLNQ